MSPTRLLALVGGPFVLVGTAYWLTADGLRAASVSEGAGESCPLAADASSGDTLESRCEAAGSRLCRTLNGAEVLVRPPYVLAGDFTEDELAAFHEDLIVPVERVLTLHYVDTAPAEPIELVLCRDGESFRARSGKLGGPRRTCYAGYYLRDARRVVVDVSTGHGTLVHELVHALVHADFPAMPEWFDEGFAAVHEECEFADGGTKLVGRPNWRRRYVRDELRRGTLRSIGELLAENRIRRDQEAVDYAHARAVCLFLQSHDRLSAFYRKLRSTGGANAESALRAMFPGRTLHEIEREFREWVQS